MGNWQTGPHGFPPNWAAPKPPCSHGCGRIPTMKSQPSDAAASPHWYRLLHACRWPFTVLATAWLLVHGAGQLLRQPITVRIDGGVNLDKVAEPIVVRSEVPLRVTGSVTLANRDAIQVAADDIVVDGPVLVEARTSIPVMAAAAIPVKATEAVAVTAKTAIPVTAPQPIHVSTGGPVSARVVVDAVRTPIRVEADQAFPVRGELDIFRIQEPVRVNVRGPLFPFPIP